MGEVMWGLGEGICTGEERTIWDFSEWYLSHLEQGPQVDWAGGTLAGNIGSGQTAGATC
jgi:hypothetical protein